MHRTSHEIIGFLFFVSLWLFDFLIFKTDTITISSIILPIVWSIIPDRDSRRQGEIIPKSHRNMWWHSIFFPLIIYIFAPITHFALIIVSAGLHCLLDIRLRKVGGFYTVKYWKGKSLGGYWFATIWYLTNFIASIGLFYLHLQLGVLRI